MKRKIYRSVMIPFNGFLLVMLLSLGVAFAGNPATGKSSITCSGPDCTQISKTSVLIDTRTFEGGGAAYIPGFNSSFYGVRTTLVTALSNTVSGDTLGIDPRWSIPIDDADIDAVDGGTDYWLFVSFADCNNGAGLVDVINDSTCTIYRSDTGQSYPNWATFTQLTNSYIAFDNYAFIIADGSGAPGAWTISNMKVGKPGK